MDIYNFYALKSVLTLKEAATALLGILEWNDEDQVCQGMYATVVRAAENDELRHPPLTSGIRTFLRTPDGKYCLSHEQLEEAWIDRDSLKEWCESKGVYPESLFRSPPNKQPANDLSPKAEGSVLTLLAAMLGLYYGLNWPDQETEQVAAQLKKEFENKSIHWTMVDRTLIKHLNKAADKMDVLRGDSHK